MRECRRHKYCFKNIYISKFFLPGELDKPADFSPPADNLENANNASGKFGGVAGVFAGVI